MSRERTSWVRVGTVLGLGVALMFLGGLPVSLWVWARSECLFYGWNYLLAGLNGFACGFLLGRRRWMYSLVAPTVIAVWAVSWLGLEVLLFGLRYPVLLMLSAAGAGAARLILAATAAAGADLDGDSASIR